MFSFSDAMTMTSTHTIQLTVNDPTLKRSGGADVLALAFGTTVAMWTVGYIGRLPAVSAAPSLVGMVMLAVLLTGGFLTGRLTGRGALGGTLRGAMVGFVVAALNLLILGSVLHGEFNAMLWVPGTLAAVTVVTAISAAIGACFRSATPGAGAGANWSGRFATIAAVATVLLLAAGGLVTGREAGLAVPDWPASYGYNMFLYPLARMTGNIYYEHAHRLYGALVGLTTIALAVHIWVTDRRGWLKALAAVAVLAVIGQGVMGGLRVSLAATGSMGGSGVGVEVAQVEHETDVSTILRVAHGVFGQMFFALMVLIAAACSTTWRRSAAAQPHEGASVDRVIGLMLVAAMLLQLLLGAMVRHLQHDVLLHVSMAAAVTLLALVGAMRAWGMHGERQPVFKRIGIAMLIVLGLQLGLGLAALIIVRTMDAATPTMADVIVTTAHQFNGAALLALAVLLAAFSFRLLRPAPAPAPGSIPEAAAKLQSG